MPNNSLSNHIKNNTSLKLEVDEITISEMKESVKLISNAISIEEKFLMVQLNYKNYEATLQNSALDYLITNGDDAKLKDYLFESNLKLFNLLATCRTYIEHIPIHANKIADHSKKEIDHLLKFEYNTTLGYRILYALRNFMQHEAFPIDNITIKLDNSGKITIDTALSISSLENSDFKKPLLNELKNSGKTDVSMKNLVRENMASFNRIHTFVRELISTAIDASITEISEFFDEHSASEEITLFNKMEILTITKKPLQDYESVKSKITLNPGIANFFISNESH